MRSAAGHVKELLQKYEVLALWKERNDIYVDLLKELQLDFKACPRCQSDVNTRKTTKAEKAATTYIYGRESPESRIMVKRTILIHPGSFFCNACHRSLNSATGLPFIASKEDHLSGVRGNGDRCVAEDGTRVFTNFDC